MPWWWKRCLDVDRARLKQRRYRVEALGRAVPEWLPAGLLIRTLVRVVSFGRLDNCRFGTIGRFIYVRLLYYLIANILCPKIWLFLLHPLH